MTYAEFAAKHGTTESRACQVAAAMLGARLRPAGWWRDEPACSTLLADRPIVDIADKLGIAMQSVNRLRSVLRREAGIPVDESRLPVGINWDVQPLGVEPDVQIAERLGVSPQQVRWQRVRRRIEAPMRERRWAKRPEGGDA